MFETSLKLFILLMEQNSSKNWVVYSKKLSFYLKNKKVIENYKELDLTLFFQFCEINFEEIKSILFSLKKNYDIFKFIKTDLFRDINYESLLIFKNNNEFLKDMYNIVKENLLDPDNLKRDKELMQIFVDKYKEFSNDVELIPNLCSLKEILILIIEIKGMKLILNENLILEQNGDLEINLDFEEFKIMILIFGKYMYFKFQNIYNYHEETYLQNLFWYLFLKLINNDKMEIDDDLKSFNKKIDKNIFYQLNNIKIRPDHVFEEGILEKIEEIFLIFGNHFSNFGNPYLNLDIRKLKKTPLFQKNIKWIKSLIKIPKPDFQTFLQILKSIIDLSKQNSTYESSLKKFVDENKLKNNIFLKTDFESIPPLSSSNWDSLQRLFIKYSVNKKKIYIMDFYFMCKEYKIVPILYSNRQLMVIFYQCNIRKLKKSLKLDFIFDPLNFYYLDFESFCFIFLEFAYEFIENSLTMDPDQQLTILFNKIIRI